MILKAKNHLTRWPALLLALLFATGSRVCIAQVDAGSLQGQVSDATGALIPRATVTLTNEATAQSETTHSDSAGSFTFSPVRIGLYTVVTETPGFTASRREHVRVDIQQQSRSRSFSPLSAPRKLWTSQHRLHSSNRRVLRWARLWKRRRSMISP